ncbi:uncharacterized protein LOC125213951 isoform X2 [Salvia hispanica]|uniref:uncharacterized protein LOC125213951 isoform X2 n=1 Tax=Salvia hispanica TaxID=49212 RepID=UPI0020099AFC|nr:uncharacterized protein LOC125213951 isoform X2 [Salvia hispanica]
MAAYAALVSLMNLIDDIENHPWPPICIDKNQVESLTQFFTFLQEFLQHYASPLDDEDEADPLEMRIMEAAYAAEDIIESYIVHLVQLCTPAVENDQATYDSSEEVSCVNLYQDLHQTIEEMDLIKKAAMEINTRNPISASSVSSTSSSSSGSSIMVCSEDLLNGIMEKLVGGRPTRHGYGFRKDL